MAWAERVVRTFTRRLGRRIERTKNKNRESDGALGFNGFHWMGGHKNQPKVGLGDGIKLGGTVRRTITMGEDAVASFRPSNLGAKKIKKNRRGLRWPPIDD